MQVKKDTAHLLIPLLICLAFFLAGKFPKYFTDGEEASQIGQRALFNIFWEDFSADVQKYAEDVLHYDFEQSFELETLLQDEGQTIMTTMCPFALMPVKEVRTGGRKRMQTNTDGRRTKRSNSPSALAAVAETQDTLTFDENIASLKQQTTQSQKLAEARRHLAEAQNLAAFEDVRTASIVNATAGVMSAAAPAPPSPSLVQTTMRVIAGAAATTICTGVATAASAVFGAGILGATATAMAVGFFSYMGGSRILDQGRNRALPSP